MKPVFLTGYMCSGKSTLGRELAEQMHLQFIDLDDFIEQEQGMTINRLFSTLGERRFREIETDALRRVVALTDVVISCGGGTPCQPGNMDLMNSHGLTVWLWTSPERIIARLLLPEHRAKRPATVGLSDEQIATKVHSQLALRNQYYAEAKIKFDSTLIETADETVLTAARLAKVVLETLDGREFGD